MTADKLPIVWRKSRNAHTEPKEYVLCPKSGKEIKVEKCRTCGFLHFTITNTHVKCAYSLRDLTYVKSYDTDKI